MRRSLGILGMALMATVGTASGPLGHVTMARMTVDGILSGQIQAPPELKSLLKDPEAIRAYCGGAIGPDIEESAHYGKTSDLVNKMLASARADLAAAKKGGNKAKIAAAGEELAFAYGWLNHSAADIAIHPVINAVTGDTYRYNGAAGKALHAELEGEFTAYLAHGKALGDYNPKVPIEFMARTVVMSKANITSGMKVLEYKAAAERKFAASASFAPQNEGMFRLVEANAMTENRAYLRDSKNLKNWDLDCGKMSTADFETLREATMRANGGSLPADWGSKYLEWHARTAGLLLAKKITVMTAILLGGGTPDRPTVKPPVDRTNIPKGGAWVLDRTEFKIDHFSDTERVAERKILETGGDGFGTAQALFGHPDPNIFILVKVKVAWTPPEKTLIPGKTYKFRFSINDAGSDDSKGMYLGGNGSIGANCPALRDVWYGPAAGLDFHAGKFSSEVTKEFTAYSAADGTEMYFCATWTVGIRAANFYYIYKFKAK